jgi:hypothetical protein
MCFLFIALTSANLSKKPFIADSKPIEDGQTFLILVSSKNASDFKN